jgi:sialic acid synthase SpsE
MPVNLTTGLAGFVFLVFAVFGGYEAAVQHGRDLERATAEAAKAAAIADAVKAKEMIIAQLVTQKQTDDAELKQLSAQLEDLRDAHANDKDFGATVFDADWTAWLRDEPRKAGR